MQASERLSQFVADALSAGHDRPDIADALGKAGWTQPEIEKALDAWADTGFVPPVPRPKQAASAREAFLYGMLFAALGVTTVCAIRLGFELIDQFLPELGESTSHWSYRSMRWDIANLVVFFPVFLLLSNRIDRLARADPSHRRSAVRRWFGYIAAFLASITLLGDLVAVVYALLDGELTARFLAKAGLTALIAGLVLLYIRDMVREPSDAP